MDRFTCLKESDITIPVGEEESSSDEEDDDDGDDGSDDNDGNDDNDDDKVLEEKVNVGNDEENQVNQRNLSRRRMVPVEKTEEAPETQNEEEDASGMKAPVSSLSDWKVSISDSSMLGLDLFSNECIHGCFDEYDALDRGRHEYPSSWRDTC